VEDWIDRENDSSYDFLKAYCSLRNVIYPHTFNSCLFCAINMFFKKLSFTWEAEMGGSWFDSSLGK
jgi:hypothetical protein